MLITVLILLIVIFDQATKYFAVLNLQNGHNTPFLPGILSFQYHENKGAAWGILSEHRWVFMVISSVAIVGIIAFLILNRKEKLSPLLTTSLAFFCGGGIGNMIDRIFLEYVIDFIKFDFIEFPIFNVADSFITSGAGLMLLYLILESISEIRKGKEKKESSHE